MLQPRERLIERALLHEERPTRNLFDTEKHGVTVQFAERNGLEDQDVQRSRQKFGSRHALSLAAKENNDTAAAQVSKGSTVVRFEEDIGCGTGAPSHRKCDAGSPPDRASGSRWEMTNRNAGIRLIAGRPCLVRLTASVQLRRALNRRPRHSKPGHRASL